MSPAFDRRPVLVALAGPHGAGKTTSYHVHLQPAGLRFVNADELARELDLDPYPAARVADTLRRSDALPHDLAERLIQKWLRFPIQDNTVTVLRSALELKRRFRMSCWDAAILAAAKVARCRHLLTEDFHHGQEYDGVVVVNPFRES